MKKGLIEVLFYIVLVFGVSFLLTTYVGQRTRVNGESMYPTLHDDDNLIVDKVSYRFSDPRRYDIIVFPYRYKETIAMPVKTVVFRMSGMSDAKRSSGVPGYASGHLNGRDLCRKGVFDESKRDY